MLAQQLAVFLLECVPAMVLLLIIYVLQRRVELAGAHRKRAVSSLPEEAAVPRSKRFDPLRGCFLNLLDELSLGESSRQCRDNVNVIRNTADMHEVGAKIPADCRQISMHPGSHVLVKPWFAILGAKDDVEDDLT